MKNYPIDKFENIIINYSLRTKAGKIANTRKINQDNYIIHKNFLDNPKNCVLGVFDGHGGDGHKVSQYLKTYLSGIFYILS